MNDVPTADCRLSVEERIIHQFAKRSLRFPRELESPFRQDYFDKSLAVVRISLVLGIILYSVFGVLDIFIAPTTRLQIWFIRYAIVVPSMIATMLFTWLPGFRAVWQIILSTVAFIAGFGIIAMIATSKDPNATRLYYAGLILVLMWSYTFNRLRFLYATVSSWIIVIGYELAAVFVQGMLRSNELLVVFINNNFFFISANIIGMVVSFLMERYARNDFLNRLLIIEKQKLLEEERNTLVDKSRIMRNELQIAKRIQQHILPQTHPDSRIYSLYRPMKEVGGDYYDFIRFKNSNRIGIFLSDVSGHGVPAAFITLMIKSTIIQSRQFAGDPAKLMMHLNGTLIGQTNEYFVTAFYGIYDFSQRSLLFTNAGHNPPYLCCGNRVMRLKASTQHMAIATIDNQKMSGMHAAYGNYRIVLPRGSKLILFTDGLVETRKKDGDTMFFESVIEEKITKYRDMKPKEFVETLYQELARFRGSEEFDDDICLICMNAE